MNVSRISLTYFFFSLFLNVSVLSAQTICSSDLDLTSKFQNHIRTLASEAFEGRAPMTKGDTLAFTYILDHFKNMPGTTLLANEGLQTFGFAGIREVISDSSFFSLNGKKLNLNVDYLPSVYGIGGSISDSIIYLAAGDSTQYANHDVKGSTVMIDASFLVDINPTEALTAQIKKAEKAGVSGVLFVTDKFPAFETNRSVTRRLPVVFVTERIAEKLKQGTSFSCTSQIEATDRGQTFTNNVVARISASDGNNPNKDCIVIGAHYDHLGKIQKDSTILINWGADDNATGIATLIELGNYFSARRNDLKRDIILIAFGAEERGLVGSNYFVANPLVPLESIKGMFNFDMTGRMMKNTLNIRGIGVVLEAFSQLSTLANPDLLNLYLIQSGQEGTDYASFNRKGVPAVSFSTGIHSDYHSPLDTEDKINYDGMKKVYNFVLPLISRFALEEGRFTPKK